MPRFIDTVDTIVNKLGTDDVGLVWGLSMVNWQSDLDLESFLDMIVRPGGGS